MIHNKRMIKRIRIGTRGSTLALWQANYIKKKIERHYPEIQLSLKHIKTKGDIDQASSLTKAGGQGIFSKSLEIELMENKIDIAVHSLKDLPTEMPLPLVVSAVPERGSIYDVFIGSHDADFSKLPQGATIACGSIRRRAQLFVLRPDLKFIDLRGNIETRLRKLAQDQVDGIIMAEAALIRLNLLDIRYYRFNLEEMLPAVSQGALGVQTRKSDLHLEPVLKKLNDPVTYLCVTAERSFLHRLDSGCQFPVAANAKIVNNELFLSGLVAREDGKTVLKDMSSGVDTNARQIGIDLAENLISQGAEKLLKGK